MLFYVNVKEIRILRHLVRTMRFFIILILVCFVTGQELPKSEANSRIQGGADVEIKDYPYQVSVQLYNIHLCGGAIISALWILTAAHCVFYIGNPSQMSIRVGSSYHNKGGRVYEVKAKIRHPQFTLPNNEYDIALILVKSSVLGDNTKVIPLPKSGARPSKNNVAVVTGWGSLYHGGLLSPKLRMTRVPVIDQKKCRVANENVTDRMFCAGHTKGEKDTCQGDSGGPVVINGKQFGIITLASNCAEANSPRVYMNVASYKSFINEYCDCNV